MKARIIIISILYALTASAYAFAGVNVNINVKRPLPPNFSDWRNDPSIIQVVLNPTQNYGSVRVTFTVTDIDKDRVVLRTKDNSPALPRFNLTAGAPLMLTGSQLVREEAMDIDQSIKDQAMMTQMLPEGNYEFCVVLLDMEGAPIAMTGLTCRQSFVVIPDPPQLISPTGGETIELGGQALPFFLWSPVANPPRGMIINYMLKIAPLFKGQNDRTAIDNNPPFYNKIVPAGRTSYQYLPSDMPLSRYTDAIGYVWQVQALDITGKPATRNAGKSETGKFFIGRKAAGGEIRLITPADKDNVKTRYPKFTWSWGGAKDGATYAIKVAKMKIGDDPAAALGNPDNTVINKNVADTCYTVTQADPDLAKLSYAGDFGGFAWQVIPKGNQALGGEGSSEVRTFGMTIQTVKSYTLPALDCKVAPPAVSTPSTKVYKKDDKLKVGEFEMVLTQDPVPDGEMIKGEGYIQIPFLKNIRIGVEFAGGIKVNTNDEIIDGTVNAKMLDGFPIVPTIGLSGEEIKKYTDKSSDNDRKVSSLQDFAQVVLPIGIDNMIKSTPFVLSIASASFRPNGAILDLAMKFSLPGLGPGADLCFLGKACAGPSGLGDNRELLLVEDFTFPGGQDSWNFIFRRGDMENKGTYVTFGEEGFRELEIKADVELPRSCVIPEPDNNGRVAFSVAAGYSKDKDLIAECAIQPFASAALTDFVISPGKAYFDLSAVANPGGMAFPDGFTGDNTAGWQGFFIPEAMLRLPKQFKLMDSKPVEGTINNLIIDGGGFSGVAALMNMADLNLGGFEATLDTFRTKIVSNSYKEGGFAGRLKLPVSDDNLNYRGTITNDGQGTKYHFSVSVGPGEEFKIPMWFAGMTLEPTSSLTIEDVNGSFKAKAKLDGNISIQAKVGPLPLNFEAMKVENFVIDEGGVKSGVFKLGSPQKEMAGFPVSAGGINVIPDNGSGGCGLEFEVNVNLYEDVLAGSTKFTIFAKRSGAKFSFDRVEIESVHLKGGDLVPGLINADGDISLFSDNAVYGDGFRGNINATVLGQVKGSVTVQFGSRKKEQGEGRFRYWYLDASIISNKGFPVFTGVGIYGFGGGAYYNMERGGDPALPAGNATADMNAVGATVSGVSYVPKESGLGFMAKVTIGTHPNATPLNADAGFEVAFLNGGLNYISINGAAYLVGALPSRSGRLGSGTAEMSYNFGNKVFRGKFGVKLGISGLAEANGELDILSDNGSNPKKWHVYVGTWDDRIGLEFLNIFKTQSYFMTGNDLPGGLPPLPQDVINIFAQCGKTISQKSNKDAMDINNGNGLAFGSNTSFSGDYRFLIFYARLAAGMGYDLNLHEYKGVSCSNTGELGINGWYAMGQMYAYVAASIGLHVDLWFVEGDFEILSGGFAAVLQGGLPNPTWAKGRVGGYYRILKGLVRGHCSFEFQVGEKCEMISENPLAMGLISDMQPVGQDVSVFTSPTATFNFPIPDSKGDNRFDIQALDKDGNPGPIRTFRIVIDESTIKSANGKLAETAPGVTDEGMTLTLTPKTVLDEKCNFKFRIKAHGEELISGTWKTTTYETGANKGKPIYKDTTVNFTSGARPNYVPDGNVIYSYPAQGQRYFIPDKNLAKKGFIAIRQEQGYLFDEYEFLGSFPDYKDNREKYKVDYLAIFKSTSGKTTEVKAEYHPAPPRVEFDITHLQTSKVYNVQIVGRVLPKVNISEFTGLTDVKETVTNRSTGQLMPGSGKYKPGSKWSRLEDIKLKPRKDYQKIGPEDISDPSKKITDISELKGGKVQEIKYGDVGKTAGGMTSLKVFKAGQAETRGLRSKKAEQSAKPAESMVEKAGAKINAKDAKSGKTSDLSEMDKTGAMQKEKKYKLNPGVIFDDEGEAIDTITTRTIDVTAMKTLQANEKPIFRSPLLFATSKFTSIGLKLASASLKTYDQKIDNIIPMVNMAMAGEPFDYVDAHGTWFKDINQNYQVFGPFLKFKIDESTDWERWAKFEIYDLINGDSHWVYGDGTYAPVPIPYWNNQTETRYVECSDLDFKVSMAGQPTAHCCDQPYDAFTGNENTDWQATERQAMQKTKDLVNIYNALTRYQTLEEAVQDNRNRNDYVIQNRICYYTEHDRGTAIGHTSRLYWKLWNIVNILYPQNACLVTQAWTSVYGSDWNKVKISNIGQLVSTDANVRNAYYGLAGLDEGTANATYWLTGDLMTYIDNNVRKPEIVLMRGINRFYLEGYYPDNPGNLSGKFITSKPIEYNVIYAGY